jgi:hypothetical protein
MPETHKDRAADPDLGDHKHGEHDRADHQAGGRRAQVRVREGRGRHGQGDDNVGVDVVGAQPAALVGPVDELAGEDRLQQDRERGEARERGERSGGASDRAGVGVGHARRG